MSSRRTSGSTAALSRVASTWLARRRREFAPAGDQLSCVDKKVGKEATLPPRPSLREGCLALLGLCGSRPTRYVRFAHCAQTGGAKSDDDARCARPAKPCAAQLVRRGSGTPRFASGSISDRSMCAAERCGMASHRPNPCSRSGTAKWRAPLLWLLSFGATNESDSPAGANSRRRRTSQAEIHNATAAQAFDTSGRAVGDARTPSG
jgi:hypothetical protein